MLEPLWQFKDQFSFVPTMVFNPHKENKYFVVCGMGGSALSAHILSTLFPDIDISVHSDYGLPNIEHKKQVLYIISSFSGNTEEALSSYDEAKAMGYRMAVVTSGGMLLEKALADKTSHIVLPNNGLEPRFTLGYQIISLLTFMQLPVYRDQIIEASSHINIDKSESLGRNIADYTGAKWPLIYSDRHTASISYAIKAAINEGAKRPCFSSVLPELNHNELEMFSSLSLEERSKYMVLLVLDSASNHRVQKRVQILNDMYFNMGASPYILRVDSKNLTESLEMLLAGYFFATFLALDAQIDPFATDTIRYFKSRLSE
jgi:glucose/mannose-6-phosphate isomerase